MWRPTPGRRPRGRKAPAAVRSRSAIARCPHRLPRGVKVCESDLDDFGNLPFTPVPECWAG